MAGVYTAALARAPHDASVASDGLSRLPRNRNSHATTPVPTNLIISYLL